MARVASPIDTRNKHIFDSVFQPGSIAPPRRINKSNQDELNPQEVRTQITRHIESLLGIRQTQYVYGWETTEVGLPFRLPLSQCADMDDVRLCTVEERAYHCSKVATSDLWRTLNTYRERVGLQQLTQMLAHILDASQKAYIRWAYCGQYRLDIVRHLSYWVENIYAPLVIMAHRCLMGWPIVSGIEDRAEVSRWTDSALTFLGALRVEEMYTVIAERKEIDGMVEDLRSFATNPATRTYLTDNFIATLTRRVLQPGEPTIEILRLYISIIRFFRQLDPRGVLLDRVAKHVRRYLRERDDTVKVVVSGLLSMPGGTATPDPDVLSEVADELHNPSSTTQQQRTELDWDNMEWMPDPADAAIDWTKSNNTDIIGSLTSLFDSKEVFVKEIQIVFAERLLEIKQNYDLEVNVLNHLKVRLGDSSLQNCEVMLRDVLESSKIDAAVNRSMMEPVHAKVLSGLFWPPMSDQTFELPVDIRERQQTYERGFAKFKSSRKLTWVHALGHVDVELELEDRTVRETVLPYQASVIYAFQSESETPAERTVADLATQLSMSPALVRSACIFWLAKGVLTETSTNTFTVLETVPECGDVAMGEAGSKQDASAAAAEAAAAQAAKEAEEEERKEKMAIYHQFVVSMLTNQGAMPLPRIAMMLNIVVPGGFPFSNDELKEFLAGMVKDGQLEVGPGGNYKAAT